MTTLPNSNLENSESSAFVSGEYRQEYQYQSFIPMQYLCATSSQTCFITLMDLLAVDNCAVFS